MDKKGCVLMEENRLEIENRIRNLVWTVSGDYTLNIQPDTERFQRENTVFFMTVYGGELSRNGSIRRCISFIL